MATRTTAPPTTMIPTTTTTRRGRRNGMAAAERDRGRRGAAAADTVQPAQILPQRIAWVFMLVALGYVALAGRLAYIQIYEHAYYMQVAEDLRERTRVLPARRGEILDRNGTLLVRNEPAADIILDPNVWYVDLPAASEGSAAPATKKRPFLAAGILPGVLPPVAAPTMAKLVLSAEGQATLEARRRATLDGLARYLPGLDVVEIAAKAQARSEATGKHKTINVRRKVDAVTAQALRQAALPGVGVLATTRRMAQNGSLAPQIVGYTDIDGRGLGGLEGGLNDTLSGKPGLIEAEFDVRGRPIPGTIKREEPAQSGRDVVLTIDAPLQHVAQTALLRAFERHGAEAATAIVLDARTFEVLACANYPSYNVNRKGDYSLANRGNRAVTSPFEPGSTLKPMTIAAALEEGEITPDTTFYCAGSRQIGRRTIHCAHGDKHGTQNVTEVIRDSCNLASAEAALRLGRKKLWEYERRFGFGVRTGAGLPGESVGILAEPDIWSDIQLANIGFGQGISVTPLQLAAAYAIIANDGLWLRPRIVKGTRAGGRKIAAFQQASVGEGRRVLSPENARVLRRMLAAVVEEGTGTGAALDGYSVGGKTGTAQIAENGHYNGKYVGSFVGMAPIDNPRFVVLVSITAPRKNGYYGGVVAAPAFKEIMQKALTMRRVPRDRALAPRGRERRPAATANTND